MADLFHVSRRVSHVMPSSLFFLPWPGGANVPALNDLLAPFGIAFGDAVINGQSNIADERVQVRPVSVRRRCPRNPRKAALITTSIASFGVIQ